MGLISQSSEQTKLMTNITGVPGIQDNNGRSSSSANKLLRRASGSFHDSSFGHNPSHSARKSLRLTIRPSTKKDNDDVIATMKHLPDLILDLETAVETSAQRPARSLHMLFALSEYGHNDNRIEMVRHRNSAIDCDNQNDLQEYDGKLVPTLLAFLRRCKTTSQEYRMTLLVLNNISIPMENKRVRETMSLAKVSSGTTLVDYTRTNAECDGFRHLLLRCKSDLSYFVILFHDACFISALLLGNCVGLWWSKTAS